MSATNDIRARIESANEAFVAALKRRGAPAMAALLQQLRVNKLLAVEGALADSGKHLVVWKSQDGAWRLHCDIWTTSQAPAAA